MSKTTGLGKGLSAIFETETHNISNAITTSYEIDIDKVIPNKGQPRTIFDDEAIEELAQSIERLGVIQPITVRELKDGRYEIISGERRYRASKRAGLRTIPAYIRVADDAQLLEMALVENVQREELGALEIAMTLERLTEELGITQEKLGQSIGKRRSTVSNYLRLLTLSPVVQDALRNEVISMGHAKVLVSLNGEQKEQEELLNAIVSKGMSVRATEEFLAKSKESKKGSVKRPKVEADYTKYSTPLEQLFGKQSVKIEGNSKGSGKIVISFSSEVELSQIVAQLSN